MYLDIGMKNRNENFKIGDTQNNLIYDYSNSIILVLSILAFFIQPFYILMTATLLQVYIRINAIYFLPIFSIALAFFWSGRHIGVTWEGGYDDAVGYIDMFLNIQKHDVSELFVNFLNQPAGNEIGYNLFVYLIGVFTNNQRLFLFLIYFTMLIFLSLASINISRRYYLLIIFLIFFGIGGFVEQAALHLFRATLAALILFFAASLFFKNKKASYFFMLLSALVHFAAIPLVLFFLFITYFKKNNKILLFFAFCLILLIQYLAGFLDMSLIDPARAMYIRTEEGVSYYQAYLLGAILIVYLFFIGEIENEVYKYSFFITGLLFFLYVLMKDYVFIAGRYLYLIQLFSTLLLFQIIKNFGFKHLISLILLILFIRKMIILDKSDFIIGAFDNYISFFSPLVSYN
jgi:hypothetical protein